VAVPIQVAFDVRLMEANPPKRVLVWSPLTSDQKKLTSKPSTKWPN
jgi:hypothetical protein